LVTGSKSQRIKEQEGIFPRKEGWGKNTLPTPLPAAEERIKSWVNSARISPGVREKIFKFAYSSLPVFIQGEEGTGKSEVAKALHFLGPWREAPFLRFFCRGLTPEKFLRRISYWLKERGGDRRIKLTLYLEEVDSLDWELQTLLLDLFQDRRIHWPGLEDISVEARILSSSLSPLAEGVSAQKFRGDLRQTLEMLTIFLEPLRQRKEEIPHLVNAILLEKEPEGEPVKRFSPEALQVLQQYDWPGNLRELESLVLRSAALKEGDLLLPKDLIFRVPDQPARSSLPAPEERDTWFDVTIPTLAHEIKNPLVAISTFAHLLPEKYDDPEFRGDFSRLVNQDVKRINDLLENLLEFAQFSPPRFTPHDLNFVLGEILQQEEGLWAQKRSQMTTDLAADLPLILFDKAQLNFVLRNLLADAWGKIDANQALHLSTSFSREEGKEGPGEFVELIVWSDGQEAVSHPLPQNLGYGMTPVLQNLSLGLLLIRKVMVRNRGQMQVRQEERGMTLRLRFAIAERAGGK